MFRPLLISLCLTSTALADVWHVDDDGGADFTTIQAAIDAASDGDTIVVWYGTYRSESNQVFYLLNKYLTIQSLSPSDPATTALTIIDGEGLRQCVMAYSGNSTINGFTIRGGFAPKDVFLDGGGGIECWGDGLAIINCVIEENTSEGVGGGISIGGSNNTNVTMTNCLIQNNTAYSSGGGVFVSIDSSFDMCTFVNCIIRNNTAVGGGGMRLNGPNCSLVDTVVCGNSAKYYAQIAGTYTDAGGNSISDVCHLGACCIWQGGMHCIDLVTSLECIELSGKYLGDDTTCVSNSCDIFPEQGACCRDSGVCSEWDEEHCNEKGGIYQGDGTLCVDTFCKAEPVGACCSIENCTDDITEGECMAMGLEFQGEGTSCDINPCYGACCWNNQCVEWIEEHCLNEGGVYQGGGTRCIDNPCGIEVGACCVGPNCHQGPKVTEDYCLGIGGLYSGDGTDCGEVPCEGACCYGNNQCAEWDEVHCSDKGGVYQGGGTICEQFACGYYKGACCYGNNQCAEWDEEHCLDKGGVYQGDGTICSDVFCCQGDTNDDGLVNVSDLLVVIDQWGGTGGSGDINFDGIVDVTDLLMVVGNWGECE